MRKLLGLILLAATVSSHADTGLVMRCDTATAATQAAACVGARSWGRPGPTDYILSLPAVAPDSTKVSWSDPALQFRPWISIPGSYGVLSCTKDLSAAQTAIGTVDNCAPGADAVAKVFVLASAVVTATVPTTPASTGSAKLTWIAPVQNTDGTALTDLTWFIVYQGAVPLAKLKPDTLTYTVTGLAPGTYTFAVTAVNFAGVESAQATTGPTTITKQTIPGSPAQVSVTVTVSVP